MGNTVRVKRLFLKWSSHSYVPNEAWTPARAEANACTCTIAGLFVISARVVLVFICYYTLQQKQNLCINTYISYFMYRVPTKILLCVQLYAFLVSTFIVPVAAIPIVVHIPPIVVNARFLANFSKLFEQLGVFGMLHTVILASVSGVGTFLNLFGVRLG